MEGKLGILGRLLRASLARMASSGAAELRHFLVGSRPGWSLHLQALLVQAHGDGLRSLWEWETLQDMCRCHCASVQFLQ